MRIDGKFFSDYADASDGIPLRFDSGSDPEDGELPETDR